jgi:hypothetical protein
MDDKHTDQELKDVWRCRQRIGNENVEVEGLDDGG